MEEQKEGCCGSLVDKKQKGFLSGLVYGLVPHIGCIGFIIFTILGVTTATAFFRPLLLNRYFFHILIAISLVFATISASIYLKKRNLLSLDGVKKKKKYLFTLYGTSVGINVLLFLIIFPIATNITSVSATGAVTGIGGSEIILEVDIPCPGHAPLISEGLKRINGVESVTYSFPNNFAVRYDSAITSKDKILSMEEFNYYPVTSFSVDSPQEAPATNYQPKGCSACGTCSGACGGTCGG
jgi:copper chaperone CopZ